MLFFPKNQCHQKLRKKTKARMSQKLVEIWVYKIPLHPDSPSAHSSDRYPEFLREEDRRPISPVT